MQVSQIRWDHQSGWESLPSFSTSAQLVLVFSDNPYFQEESCFNELREKFPQAQIIGCSSAGSIAGVSISDGDMIATVVQLEDANIRMVSTDIGPGKNAQEVGEQLMSELASPELRHVFVLSDGLHVNGSDLALGLNQAGLPVTGGLAGDGTRFGNTLVMANAPAKTDRIVALGFYGDLTIKSGCFSGCEEFGADRMVTKSIGNIVYEIDNQPALALYKKYLGEQASELPASGLRFPLGIQVNKKEKLLIRTLLGVDEGSNSLTFAGDVPQGYLCKLMRTNSDLLIENAGMAADATHSQEQYEAGLCLVVSCVGRRLVMGQLTEEELEEVQEKLGEKTTIAGFYSYGELAPFRDILQCQLHNQTMTLTTIYE
ncbi:hypothetical protein PSHI8_16030 [Polynucleobacter sp. SHI8]|uniref:FIST signal transduction protein n=1 Tax=unclassified Polynucleobacter TaxID=2640945 RepID=UPI002490DAD1|nr:MULTISPECIES: FIST N-terminal domain-containing protein [unclassified Polynucleobacter]BDW11520.1 hypothetical protein PSHI2_16020 [Polynucleobacter sp. SHI2]BDW13967.1 hypothetical protein PSHI8_16030 [Polynucleobacter sp. SHI8]